MVNEIEEGLVSSFDCSLMIVNILLRLFINPSAWSDEHCSS